MSSGTSRSHATVCKFNTPPCTHGGVLNLHTVGFSACQTTSHTTRQHSAKHNTQQSTTHSKAQHFHRTHNTWQHLHRTHNATQHALSRHTHGQHSTTQHTSHRTHTRPTHQHHRPTPTQVIYSCSYSFATFFLINQLLQCIFQFFELFSYDDSFSKILNYLLLQLQFSFFGINSAQLFCGRVLTQCSVVTQDGTVWERQKKSSHCSCATAQRLSKLAGV